MDGEQRAKRGLESWWWLLLPLLVSAGTRGWWAPDEPRYAEVAKEIFAPGGDFLVMHLTGEVYPDKPPLLFWLAGALGALTGWSEFAMRLVTILATLGTALAVRHLARRWWGAREGGLAAGAFLGTAMVSEIGGRLQLDPLLTLFTTLALVLLENPQRTRGGVRLAWLLVGLGVLTKGPVAILIPSLVLLAWRLRPRARVRGRVAPLDLISVLLALLPAGLWAGLAILSEPALLGPLLFGQHLGRLGEGGGQPHFGPWWKYLSTIPALALPWTLPLVVGLLGSLRGRSGRKEPQLLEEDRGLLRAALWFFALLLFFSLLPPKRDLYLLPAYPALALVSARAFVIGGAGGFARLARRSVALVPLLLGVVLLLGALVVAQGDLLSADAKARLAELPEVAAGTSGLLLRVLPGALVLILASYFALRRSRGRAATPEPALLHLSFGLGVALLMGGLFPVLDTIKSSRLLADRLAALIEEHGAPRVPFFDLRPEGPRFYRDLKVVYASALEESAPPGDCLLARWRGALDQQAPGSRLAVLERKTWHRVPPEEQSHWRVLLEDRLGGKEFVLVGQPTAH